MSPTDPSYGALGITQIGPGLYDIFSGVDLVTEISLGGESFVAGDVPIQLDLVGPSLAVPEPASLGLLGLGVVALAARRRR